MLVEHYQQRLGDKPLSTRFAPLLNHAEAVSFQPVQASPLGVQTLTAAGFNEEEIVTLSQIVGFIAFQSRLLRGLRMLGHKAVSGEQERVPGAGEWHRQPQSHSGKPVPQALTREALGWEAWLGAKAFSQFSVDEQETLKRFGHHNSGYFRLLGRNLPVLEQRTLTDKGIFFTSGGLPRAERELAATVASKINGCIFCASVHARKAGQLAKDNQAIDKLLAVQPGHSLSEGPSPHWLAEINFAASLSATPATASQHQLATLRVLGLRELE